ncbi:methylaspartate ammonia-lyase [Mycoplasmatota bacterium WC44]
MKVSNVVVSKGLTGFYFDDQRAIKAGALSDGFTYRGEVITPNFTSVRQAGESISIMLIMEDGSVGLGDATAVQYSGCGGRDPLFIADEFVKVIEKDLKPLLVGRELNNFKENAEYFDSLEIDGTRLHTALRYGITQAILSAVSKVNKVTIADTIKKEYNIETEILRPSLFAQSGDNRYENVDKMIIKKVDVLPHGLINNIETKLGRNGELLKEYIEWLRDRILALSTDYFPVLHLDVYGTIGEIFENDLDKMADYLKTLEESAHPFKLRIEGPSDLEDRDLQVQFLSKLTALLDSRDIKVEIVADEWCNNLDDITEFAKHKAGHMLQIKTPDLGGVNNIVDAILVCKKHGVGAYSGGTCNETNVSSEITTNIAMAAGADQVLAKPGMGTDEGIMIVNNEMNRVMALVRK